jgi:hypothetical protein
LTDRLLEQEDVVASSKSTGRHQRYLRPNLALLSVKKLPAIPCHSHLRCDPIYFHVMAGLVPAIHVFDLTRD